MHNKEELSSSEGWILVPVRTIESSSVGTSSNNNDNNVYKYEAKYEAKKCAITRFSTRLLLSTRHIACQTTIIALMVIKSR